MDGVLVVYIAGAFRAENAWLIENNVRLAETWAARVWKLGAVAVCPHTNSRFFQGIVPDEVWTRGYLGLLKRCDTVLMMWNWKLSQGATQEHDAAKELLLPIFYAEPSRSSLPTGLIELINSRSVYANCADR